MVKIAHCADIHFGSGRGSIPDYLERTTIAGKNLVRSFRDEKVNLVIVAGDLFHRKDMKPSEIGAFVGWCNQLNQLGVPVIMQAGNHDLVTKDTTLLDLLSDVAEPLENVTFHSKTTEVEVAGLRILIIGHEDNECVDEILERSETPDILVLHAAVVGGKMDNGYVSPTGINIKTLPHVPYIALGDFHRRQKIGNAVYPGSPYQTRFGEDSLNRGYVTVAFEKRKFKKVDRVNIPQPTPLIRVFAVKQEDLKKIPEKGWVTVHVGPGVDTEGLPDHVLTVNTLPNEKAIKEEAKTLELSEPLIDPLEGFEEMVAKGGFGIDDEFMEECKAEARRIVEEVGV